MGSSENSKMATPLQGGIKVPHFYGDQHSVNNEDTRIESSRTKAIAKETMQRSQKSSAPWGEYDQDDMPQDYLVRPLGTPLPTGQRGQEMRTALSNEMTVPR